MDYLIQTSRIGIRNWKTSDIEPMIAISGDERVMEFFPAKKTRQETIDFIKKMQAHFEKTGYCYFAADRLDTGEFIGFIGIMYQDYETDFTPCVDIGWRLKPSAWGNGFATEGAKACLKYAFEKLDLKEIYAIAPKINTKSERVMQKIGLQKMYEFDHPLLLNDERLKVCVLYKIEKAEME